MIKREGEREVEKEKDLEAEKYGTGKRESGKESWERDKSLR